MNDTVKKLVEERIQKLESDNDLLARSIQVSAERLADTRAVYNGNAREILQLKIALVKELPEVTPATDSQPEETRRGTTDDDLDIPF